ncbi:MAG: D-alanine--D-alanine ligase, partial [bacterium]|nr:D-alanine--D-alanine ligase [bacterium]
KVSLVNTDGKVYLTYLDRSLFKKSPSCEINVAFPIVHGTNCEDGTLAGFLEFLRLPYVGCDVLSAAIGMDKAKFKTILEKENIPVLPCITFSSRQWADNQSDIKSDIEAKVGYPLIVKPINLGSSVGISKVENEQELFDAVNLACSFSENLLIEKAITKLREINCSVLGDSDNCSASVLEEPIMSDKILSYSDKYLSNSKNQGSKGMASLSREIPANLSKNKTAEIQLLAEKTFRAIGASGVCRIDFLVDTENDDTVYVNEANTIPGSLSFYLWEASGMPYRKLIDELISLAFKRDRKTGNLMYTIKTNILSNANLSGAKGSKGKL